MKRLRLVITTTILFLSLGQAHAATVIFLRPPTPSPEVMQALTLFRGELLSVGHEVVDAERAPARPAGEEKPEAWLGPFAVQGASAVVDPIGTDTLEAIDVWILKEQPQAFEVAHVAVDPTGPKQMETLVLRALEALRAGLLQMDWAARKRRNEPVQEAPKIPEPAPQVPHGPSERIGLELGAVGMMSPNNLGPAVMPSVGVGWAVQPWLILQATAAGLGTRPTVSNTAGSARVAQQYALVGACLRFGSAQRVWPFVGISAGALHTTVEGRSGLGTTGHTLDRWSALFDLGLGAGLRLSARFFMTLSAHVQLAEPYAAIRIVDSVAATAGHPTFVVPLTLGAWL